MDVVAALAFLAQRAAEIEARFTLDAVVALIAGVLILVFPRLLNYIVAAFLILFGLINIFDLSF